MRHTNIPGANGNAIAIGRMGFARLQFADWLKENHPSIFQQAVEMANAEPQSGLGQAEAVTISSPAGKSFWEKFTDAAMGLGTTYLSLKNQRDAMKLNFERAKSGLPPIDMATTAPVIRTQVDLDPRLASQLVSNVGSQAMRMTLIIGAVVLAGLLLMKKK